MPNEKLTIKDWILGMMYGAALLIAGSDGDWFPWFNIAGVIIVGIFMLVAIKKFKNGRTRRHRMVKRQTFFVIFILFTAVISSQPARAITWHNADQATVAWDAPTQFTDGSDIPDGVILEYEVITAVQPDKSDQILAGRTANLNHTHTMAVEGRIYCGVRAVRIMNGDDVSRSAIAWSDNPEVCKDGETFGIQYYLVPDLPINLYKQ